jgi:3-methyladenine DNA glycosylase AlkC
MATLAVHDKKADDEVFLTFLPIIKNGSTDERNFVKKAVNWTLRQIGKRNANLNKAAIKTAEEIKTINSKSARWIAADALRKLTSEAVARTVNKFSLDSLLSQIDENNVHSEIKTSSAQGNEAW